MPNAQIVVQRTWKTDNSTIGTLTFGALRLFTLEDVVRPAGAPKVYGKTAIPAGTYEVQISFSNHFQKDLPILLAVPGFEGVRIHPGNKAADTEGCLLLGLAKGVDVITQSVDACNKFMPVLKDALKQGKVYIEYRD